MDVLFPGIDNNGAQGPEIRSDMAAGFDRSVAGFSQTDYQPMDAIGKVVKLLLDAIQNESLATLIAFHHVVMHKNLHGLSFFESEDRQRRPAMAVTTAITETTAEFYRSFLTKCSS